MIHPVPWCIGYSPVDGVLVADLWMLGALSNATMAQADHAP
jgi:hypothetical protein